MKKGIAFIAVLALSVCFTGCNDFSFETVDDAATTAATQETTTDSASSTTTSATTKIMHSPLYIDGVEVESVIDYFNEVCLDAEMVNSGDATLLQKWDVPIYYQVNGAPTNRDREVMSGFAAWLNTVEGFPGIFETSDTIKANLQIHFCSQAEMLSIMGDNFTGLDGAVTFWYNNNAIYKAVICCRTDLDQTLRNSVILEEIYNGLGPIQDSSIRTDSIIYSGYSQPQQLTEIDQLILRLLYHPSLRCGMNAEQCAAAIRGLYY